jgi:amino acid transporter
LLLVASVGLALALWLGLRYDPITGLSIMVVTSTSLYVTIYILVNIACAAYFLRHRRDEHNLVRHLIAPVIGTAAFVPVLMVQLGIPAFSFVSKLAAPLTYGAYAAFAIAAAGLIAALVIGARDRSRLTLLGRAFDETSFATTPASSPAPATFAPPAVERHTIEAQVGE